MRRPIQISVDPFSNNNPMERVVEFSSVTGGGMIAIRVENETVVVDIFHTDGNVVVTAPVAGKRPVQEE